MTSRERWTVYPLLFLALGLAVRSIAVPQGEFGAARVDSLESTRLVCKEIVIENDDGTILVHMGRVVKGGGGRIEIKDKDGVESQEHAAAARKDLLDNLAVYAESVALFRQKLRDQSLDVKEQNGPVRVLRVGPESVDHKRERSTLLLNLLFNINLGFKL